MGYETRESLSKWHSKTKRVMKRGGFREIDVPDKTKNEELIEAIEEAIEYYVVVDLDDIEILQDAIERLSNGESMTPQQAGKWSKYANK